jgi:hypothetical protein
MSDSQRLHASLLSVLQPSLMQEDFRNVDTLAWAMTGVLMQKTVNLPAWAVIVPDQSEAKVREVRFRRWLQNPKLDAQSWYTPFITGALTDWKKSTVHIALDATRVNNRLVIVRTALIYRQRAVPLAWRVFQRQSVMLAFEHYAPVLRYTATLLPPGATVILLGDRGFRDIQLMQLARELKWHFRLRLAENEYFSTVQQGLAPLNSLPLTPAQPRFLHNVCLTQQSYGPVHWALMWDGDPTHDPWRLASDQRTGPQTLIDYALRMGIEFGFLDDKSAGFQLEDSELLRASQLNRLLTILALCSLWLLSLGTDVVDSQQRKLVDTHWTRGLSYLQLGWRWLDYCLARDAPLPLKFHLEPTPDPEPVRPL